MTDPRIIYYIFNVDILMKKINKNLNHNVTFIILIYTRTFFHKFKRNAKFIDNNNNLKDNVNMYIHNIISYILCDIHTSHLNERHSWNNYYEGELPCVLRTAFLKTEYCLPPYFCLTYCVPFNNKNNRNTNLQIEKDL